MTIMKTLLIVSMLSSTSCIYINNVSGIPSEVATNNKECELYIMPKLEKPPVIKALSEEELNNNELLIKALLSFSEELKEYVLKKNKQLTDHYNEYLTRCKE